MGNIKIYIDGELSQEIYHSKKDKKKRLTDAIKKLERVNKPNKFVQIMSDLREKRSTGRPIVCYDKNWNELEHFENVHHAVKTLGIPQIRIYHSLSYGAFVKEKYFFKYL